MKATKKILSLLLVAMLVMALSVSAFAQTVALNPADADNAKITISNAAKGETYKVAKLFDATVSSDGKAIAYTGDVPSALDAYFAKDASTGAITAKTGFDPSDATTSAALKTWAEANVTNQAVSDGSVLEFTGLPYGYYIVTTTQGEALVSVNSTMPNAEVTDKNTTPPIGNPSKSASENDVFVGDTVEYTVSFTTANYTADNKLIVKYIIKDNFADGALENVTVTSLKIGGVAQTVQQFDATGKIELDWVDASNKSLYANGAEIELVYTAKVAATAPIDGAGSKNTVTIDYEDENGGGNPSTVTTEDTIYTYAVAIKKVNAKGEALAGAKFELPFYVNETAASDGAYVYAGATAGTGLVKELTTPASGLIIIKGVKSGSYSFTETEAPAGYNKLAAAVSVNATKTGSTTTSVTKYIDANGNIVDTKIANETEVTVTIADLAATPVFVVNQSGTELPATGGVGTTVFYVLGSCLLLGAAVLMITRRRMGREG